SSWSATPTPAPKASPAFSACSVLWRSTWPSSAAGRSGACCADRKTITSRRTIERRAGVTVNRLLELAATFNPGFYIMAAALLAAFAKDAGTRGLALIGGPALALTGLLYPTVTGMEASRQTFLGFELALYLPDSLSL